MKDEPNPSHASNDSGDLGNEVHFLPDRRSHERYELDTQLTATVVPEHTRRIYGRTIDISIAGLGGIFVANLDVGSHVYLDLRLPIAKEPLLVEAVVRNRNGHRYGFEFINLGGRDRLLIHKAVRVLAVLQ